MGRFEYFFWTNFFSNFWGKCSRFLEVANMYFTSWLFVHELFYVLALNHFLPKKPLRCLIMTFIQHFWHKLFFVIILLFLSLFYFVHSFFNNFFINSYFKKKSVTQVSIKKIKNNHFSFTFKLNQKNQVPLKMYFEKGVTKKLCWKSGFEVL